MNFYPTEISLLADRDGGWSLWGHWSACNKQCGAGLRWRSRECSNPTAQGHGRDCEGHTMEGQECNSHSCNGKLSRENLHSKPDL